MIALHDRNGTDDYATRGVLFHMPSTNREGCERAGHRFESWLHSRGRTRACRDCGLLALGESDPFLADTDLDSSRRDAG